MNRFTHIKLFQIHTGILLCVIGVFLSLGVTPARAAVTPTWSAPSAWITSGSVISAQKISDNFNYLYSQLASTSTSTSNVFGFGNAVNGPSYGLLRNRLYPLLCQNGYAASGVKAWGAYSGGFVKRWVVNRIQPICTSLTGTASTTSATLSVWTPSAAWIKDGNIVSATNMVGNFNYLRNELIKMSASFGFGAVVYGPAVGNIKHGSRSLVCPKGDVMTGIRVWGAYKGWGQWPIVGVFRWITSGVQVICTPVGYGVRKA